MSSKLETQNILLRTNWKTPKKERSASVSVSWKGSLLLLVVSSCFILFAAEIMLRILPLSMTQRLESEQQVNRQVEGPHPKGLYALHQEIGWTLAPNYSGRFQEDDFDIHISANSDGIRNSEVGRKQAGTYRILGLGDSFAFGWGVSQEESFYKVLEHKLNEGTDRYEVVNAGIPGFGTYEAFQLLKTVGLAYDPDLVILAFYEGNDYRNNADAPRERVIENGYLKDVNRSGASALPRFLVRNSVLAALVNVKMKNLKKKRAFQSSIEKTKQILLEMKHTLDSRGVPLAVILIPDQDSAFYERSGVLRMYDRLAAGADLFEARGVLRQFAREHHIHFYQLSERFENSEASGSLRLRDTHFNEKGHARAAHEMMEFLKGGAL